MVAFAIGAVACVAQAQLVSDVNAIPKTGKLPVVFLNGFQLTCGDTTFKGTFGIADQILEKDGRASLFFDNCAASKDHPPIEELGNKFGQFLQSLKYATGESVGQVDVVAHSMGGLILRSYLSGKQVQEGVFMPPADTRIRKAVFLGTPHFGSQLTLLLGGSNDRQGAEMEIGSAFTFDLATWNQGIDDLRGVDAVSVLGAAGNGQSFVILPPRMAGFDDGVTSLTSGSLGFYAVGRTRIVPYCHTDIAGLLCSGSPPNLADINGVDHLSAKVILSFLNDTDDWRSIGESAEQNTFLSKNAGLLLKYRDASDREITPQSATTTIAGRIGLRPPIVYSEFLPTEQPVPIILGLPNGQAQISIPLAPGSTRAVVAKSGPTILAVFPSASAAFPRVVAPGSLVSIYGSQLVSGAGDVEVTIAGQKMPVSFASSTQINTLVPEDASGLLKVQVKNTAGEHTVNLLLESVVPSLFAPALNAATGTLVTEQSPLRPGDFVALFLTGLGKTTARDGLNWAVVQPEVTVGGQACAVTFAGRAPGYPGLDQINCQLASNVPINNAAQVVVRSGSRFSNATTLPVR